MGVSFGAGLGRLQGKYGLLHDNMVSCELVLADGSLISVSKESHPDLFWAIRGAGHNFGIAVQATFQVYPEASGGTHYSWDLEFGLEQCDEVFRTLNEVHADMPAHMAIFVLWNRQSKSGLKVELLSSPSLRPSDLTSTASHIDQHCMVRNRRRSRSLGWQVSRLEATDRQRQDQKHMG